MNRLALIDLGTNTFHLLIVDLQEGRHEQLLKLKVAVKLGEGGISRGFIAPEAYERALTTLADFAARIKAYEVRHVWAVATSAMRNARNGLELVQAIEDRTGIKVEVISGAREAELIYEGVKLALPIGTETSLIMDIGGGSVEFIICNEHEIFWKHSFELGAQRLLDAFHRTDPITTAEILSLKNYLTDELKLLTTAVDEYHPHLLIGSSGTFDTLCDIQGYRTGQPRTGTEIESDLRVVDFYRIYEDLVTKTREERMEIPGMIEMRVDMIVVASVLIDFVVNSYRLHHIRVSSYALKEGLMSQLLLEQANAPG